MNLKESLLSDMKGALKARDSLKLITIRGLISEIKNREIDVGRDLVEDEIISIIFTAANLVFLSLLHDEKFGYAAAEMIPIITTTTISSKRLKPLIFFSCARIYFSCFN